MAKVLVISSQVESGFIGGTISERILRQHGHETVLVPTVTMAAHPGHGSPTKTIPPSDDFAETQAGTAPDHILTGYFVSVEQIRTAAKTIKKLKEHRPDTLCLCDPIMGDMGQGLYVPQLVADAIKSELVPLADILCPNTFELGFLAEQEITDAESAAAAARTLGRKAVLCTSVPAGEDTIATLLVTKDEVWQEETPRLEDVPHGTGDLLAALFLSYHLNGATLAEAHTLAVTYTYGICRKSVGHKDLRLV